MKYDLDVVLTRKYLTNINVPVTEMFYNGNLIKVHISELTLQCKSNLSTRFPENN